MSKSRPLSSVSRVPWKITDYIAWLEIDGVPGLLLPAEVTVSAREVRLRWAGTATQPLDLKGYRICLGDKWIEFVAEPTHVAKGDGYVISASLKLN